MPHPEFIGARPLEAWPRRAPQRSIPGDLSRRHAAATWPLSGLFLPWRPGPWAGAGLCLLLLCQPAAAQAPADSPAPPRAEGGSAVTLLLDQASYWQAQNRPDAALQSLERLLRLQPNDTRALAMAAQVAASAGDAEQAQAYLNRLAAVAPGSQELARARSAMRATAVDQAGLAEARQLAQSGRGREALLRYRAAFGTNEVPDAFAVEYYLTQAGLSADDFREARRGLEAAAQRQPDNQRMKLAVAQLLTFRETTRPQGIEQLRALATQPETASAARAAWRQALLWLGPGGEALAALEQYRSQFPGDQEIDARYEEVRHYGQDPNYETRQAAYDALSSQRLSAAESGFTTALDANPNDVDSLMGLAILRRRQNRDAEWRALLARAVALAPEREAEFNRTLGLGQGGRPVAANLPQTPALMARQAFQRRAYDEAERQAQRAIASHSANEQLEGTLVLAQLALQRGEWAVAEASFRDALNRRPSSREAQAGLYTTLERQGRWPEADAMAQATGFVPPRGFAAGRAAGLRQAAERESDPDRAVALLQQGLAVDPGNVWVAHDLVRRLRAQGRPAEAAEAERNLAALGTPDALYAAALLAASEERERDVVERLGRVPANARTAEMKTMLEGARIRLEVAQWEAQLANPASRPAAQQALLAIAARRDPSGQSGAAVIRAFGRARMPEAARAALRLAASGPTLGIDARLQMGGALLEAKLRDEAAALLAALDTASLSGPQRGQLQGMRNGLVVSAADDYAAKGDIASASALLGPALQNDPENPALLLSLARLNLKAGYPAESQRIAEAVLQAKPDSLEALMTAGEAALAQRQWSRADQLVSAGLRQYPSSIPLYMMEARLARAQNDSRRAERALTTAQRLRMAQLQTSALP
ncbi:tetratricopeptide repeat protein [Roseomonas sp. GC11]|uniref:tetratricopeptide repeat protein n=1 Tax=Roseomonas sp. GC11 TaxID=2950546 RepID=UPI002108BF35|nr:tetratricopeptide repeat protein [Roseomonas sp. GC11]